MAIKYNEEFDAHYDDKKDVWLECGCKNNKCPFCTKRPGRPSDVIRE